MDDTNSQQKHLDNLRKWRNHRPRDVSTDFLNTFFKNDIQKPFKQLKGISEAWAALVPSEIIKHTCLEKLNRGVLTVTVNSSAILYELDMQLRSGLQKQLRQASKGANINRIKLVVGKVD